MEFLIRVSSSEICFENFLCRCSYLDLISLCCCVPVTLFVCVCAYYSLIVQVWNSIGIVTQYSTEEEESIDIEFHDSATHHAMHISNALGHTMADLSAEAVLLATEADEDNPRSALLLNHSEVFHVI